MKKKFLKSWEIAILVGIVLTLSGIAYAFLAYESISVSTTALGLTSTTYKNSTHAIITCESASIRWTFDGITTPNSASSVGHLLFNGQSMILDSQNQIRNFKAVRANDTDAVLKVSYWAN